MARGRLRLEWDQTAELWIALVEPHRDTESRPEPYRFEDIHPLHRKPKTPEGDGPNFALWSKLTRNVNVKTIDLTKLPGWSKN